ncbi:DNA transposition protein [Rhodospirillum sp. A1_3_36]|uniref:DNA transposition protein n=1 Tax=Rhodospirillum sp. A1_3_36 TaxID=3391666 RepID=UPI0039A5D7D3
MRWRDPDTLDLFDDFVPVDPVVRFDPVDVRSATLRDSISRAVAATLDSAGAAGLGREEIAARLTDWTGEPVSRAMVNAYASQGRRDHTISFARGIGLSAVTGDPRLFQLGAEAFGHIVVPKRFAHWVRVGQAAEAKAKISRTYEKELRAAKGAGL